MESSYAKFRSVRFFGSLDGLRALSIVGVVWFHSWSGTADYPRFAAMPVLRQGAFGVDVFFVVSGFLITTLLRREADRYGTISLRDFYIRRALRIWPLYYAVMLVYIVNALLFERDPVRAQSFLYYLPSFATFTYTWFITANWPVGMFSFAWTLAAEEQFYLFWPFVLRFLRGRWSSVVIALVIALKIAADRHLTSRILPPGWLPTRIVLSIAVPICMGVLLAQALHSQRGFHWLHRVLGWKWAAPAILVALLVCLAPIHPPMLLAFVVTTALVGACVVREDNGLAGLLQLRPVALIGTLSYGIYLLNSLSIHVVHFALARLHSDDPSLTFLLALGLTTAAAYLSYRYYESPFLALKNKFSHLRPVSAQPVPAEAMPVETQAPIRPQERADTSSSL